MLLYCICGAAGQARTGRVSPPSSHAALMRACRAIQQNFIFFAIAGWGSLVNITITTTRKVCDAAPHAHARCAECRCALLSPQFFSVLFSVFYNKSYLLAGQWVGVALVFIGLGAPPPQQQQPYASDALGTPLARRPSDSSQAPRTLARQQARVTHRAYTIVARRRRPLRSAWPACWLCACPQQHSAGKTPARETSRKSSPCAARRCAPPASAVRRAARHPAPPPLAAQGQVSSACRTGATRGVRALRMSASVSLSRRKA